MPKEDLFKGIKIVGFVTFIPFILAAAVTVASRMLQTLVEGIVECGTQILYLPNCITDIPAGNGDEVRGALGIAVGTPVVLLYSRFFEFSQDKLYSVCSGILRQVPEVRFLVVGRGRHNEELLLKEYCLAHGFGENLVMAGWLDPVEIPAYLAAADVAIYPFNDTMINRCKCPAKLTEIMRAGVPVVADCVGQLAEYIRPGLSGMLCEPDKWEEMVEQTVHLLKQRNEGQQLGIAGRNYLLDTFSWNIYAASLNELYCCLIRDNSKDV